MYIIKSNATKESNQRKKRNKFFIYECYGNNTVISSSFISPSFGNTVSGSSVKKPALLDIIGGAGIVQRMLLEIGRCGSNPGISLNTGERIQQEH